MKRIAVAVAAAAMLNASPGLAATDAASGPREAAPAAMYVERNAHAATPPTQRGKERRPYGHHRHRIVVIYVPAYAAFGAPYYYAPSVPYYVDQDPPDYAYRELNGFYYWCPDPAGYYPDRQDCPIGWRLVAP